MTSSWFNLFNNQTNVKTCYETHEIHIILFGSPDMNRVVSIFF